MSEIKTPTCGRMIHFFPVKDPICSTNGATKLPAVVIQNWDNLSANVQVLTMCGDAPNVLRYSVCHATEVVRNDEGEAQSSYWDWPEIK